MNIYALIYLNHRSLKVLTVDGYIITTERDEFIYHEMMTHVPMAVHPDPRKILVSERETEVWCVSF